MPPKKKGNGYFMFMVAERKRIQAETKQTPSMAEMAALCSEAWKNLSPQEKASYNAMAKQDRGKDVQDRDMQRMDNQGQIIAHRKAAAKDAIYKRTQENQLLVKSWEGRDILDIPFHVINFQVMYTEEPIDYYLPMEIGMVCFTLRDGITKYMHRFIDPGDAPHGNMHLALKHSENTHKIPLHFKEADRNFLALWMQIEKFVVNDPRRDDIPPIFCLMSERKIVETCLEYIQYHARSGEPNISYQIYYLEDLVMSLLLKSGKVSGKPSETQIRDSLLRNQWDYLSFIRCSYHDEVDSPCCSLSKVRRLTFSMFDMLSKVLDFKLTAQHLPDEASNNKFTVMYPSAARRSDARGGRNGHYVQSTTDINRSPSPPPFAAPFQQSATPGKSWSAPRTGQVEVKLSDSDDSEADSDTDEVKSTSDQYTLAELRKPKAPTAMLSNLGLAYGRGLTLPGNTAFNSGGGLGQMRYSNPIRPPPGFDPRPGVIPGSMIRPQSFPRPVLNNLQAERTLNEETTISSAQGRGWAPGRGRGRGMPPEVRPS